jgi:hypothetical protein
MTTVLESMNRKRRQGAPRPTPMPMPKKRRPTVGMRLVALEVQLAALAERVSLHESITANRLRRLERRP